ncbi:hypothetical protein ElyMa_000690400 [Elysia marginata]|uniref:Uncharacterized protein n=1 Tax=Elysia marginata TaxID=1093978 RepID=A0AAV4GI96_9GAST|nr:hypothetical protein ElyMa_000690400 [Elysia marginata]
MLTDLINWRPVVYDCLPGSTPHIASAAKQAKPSCRDGPQVDNKARGRRGTQQSTRKEGYAFVAPCLHLHAHFTVTVAGHLVTAGHFVCRFTSQVNSYMIV